MKGTCIDQPPKWMDVECGKHKNDITLEELVQAFTSFIFVCLSNNRMIKKKKKEKKSDMLC